MNELNELSWIDLQRIELMWANLGRAEVLRGLDGAAAAHPAIRGQAQAIAEAIRSHARALGSDRELTPLVHNYLRGVLGWSAERLLTIRWPERPWIGLLRPLARAEAIRRNAALFRGALATSVRAYVLLNDQRRVLAEHRDEALRTWDLHDGALLATSPFRLDRKSSACWRLSFEQRRIIVCSDPWDGPTTFTIRELANGAVVSAFVREGASARFAPLPGERHVVVLADGAIELWDIERGVRKEALAGPDVHRRVLWEDVTTTPDGRTLLVFGRRGDGLSVHRWDIETRRYLGVVPDLAIDGGHVPDGRLLLAAHYDSIDVYDLAAGVEVGTLTAASPTLAGTDGDVLRLHSGLARVVVREATSEVLTTSGGTATADGRMLVTERNGVLDRWEVALFDGGTLPARVPRPAGAAHGDCVAACVVAPDGASAVTLSLDGSANWWDGAGVTCRRWLVDRVGQHHRCIALPDGKRLASLDANERKISLYDWKTGVLLLSCAIEGFFEWTADGRYFAVSSGAAMQLYSLDNLEPASPPLPGGAAWCVTPDESRVAVAIASEGVCVFARATGEHLQQWAEEKGRSSTWMVAFPDSRRIAFGGPHDQVVVTTLDGRDRVTLLLPAGGSTGGTVVGADELLVTTDDGGWQLASTRLLDWRLSAPRAHRLGCAPLVAVGPDARIVVEACRDRLCVHDRDHERDAIIHGYAAFTAVGVMRDAVLAGDANGDVWSLALHGRPASNGECK